MTEINVGFYSWYAANTVDPRVLDAFKSVICHHDLADVHELVAENNLNKTIHHRHGSFILEKLRQSTDDVSVFLDVDCLITDLNLVYDLCRFAFCQDSFAGVAHNVGHTNRPHHIFVGAPLVAISTKAFKLMEQNYQSKELNSSSIATQHTDTCQNWSLLFERLQKPYFASYPIGFDANPFGMFGNYGLIGRGIHYKECYHLLGASDDSWPVLRHTREPAIERFLEIAQAIISNQSIPTPRFKANDITLFQFN